MFMRLSEKDSVNQIKYAPTFVMHKNMLAFI